MSSIKDEMLMAYADGELSAVDAAGVEAALAGDADARVRQDIFALTGRGLGKMFDEALPSNVPQHLVDSVMAYQPGANVVAFPGAGVALRQPRKQRGVAYFAMAAAFAALLIGGAGMFLSSQNIAGRDEASFAVLRVDGEKRVASPELADVLESGGSGDVADRVVQGSKASLKPLFTFIATDGSFCRQYEIHRDEAARALRGVACREGDKVWRVEAHALAKRAVSGVGGIKPAGGPEMSAAGLAVERLIAGDALGENAERALMQNGWKFR